MQASLILYNIMITHLTCVLRIVPKSLLLASRVSVLFLVSILDSVLWPRTIATGVVVVQGLLRVTDLARLHGEETRQGDRKVKVQEQKDKEEVKNKLNM